MRGEVSTGAILTNLMWHMDIYGGHNAYAIFGDCRLRGVGVVRGVILPFPIDLRYRLYNTGHTAV